MANRYSLEEYLELKERSVLLDTNVLLFVFHSLSPSTNITEHVSEKQKLYSQAYYNLLKHSIPMAVTVEVLSEFFNRTLRNSYEFYKSDFPYFKKFRNSEIGKNVQKIAVIGIRNILSRARLISTIITNDILLESLEQNSLDFTDMLIYHTCQKENLVLMTDDGDFRKASFDIFSHNPVYR